MLQNAHPQRQDLDSGCRGLKKRENRKYDISFWSDENVPELDSDDCITL